MLKWIKNFFAQWKKIEEQYASQPCDNGGCNDCICGYSSDNKGNG